ncbi:ATP-binding protein [Legionella clemsonensis]|uniref:histidine kinase n=1 Tax=Legionella clemsonensis TaxID=1867846 RepID=A0A222P2X9_9GAMM|nr:ATP-binding protein [Legionella clemsonensis]ASQ46181.1 Aerobic respiration control sensor protein ArcB [Legionella clemsonensis]
MTTVDGQALSTILQMAQEPILLVSEEYIILDVNNALTDKLRLKKNLLVGTSLTNFCSKEDLEQTSKSHLKQIILKTKKNKCICYALIIEPSTQGEKETIAPPRENTSYATPIQKNIKDYSNTNYQYLEAIISEIPVSVYWMNKDYIYLGCSNSMAKLLNLQSRHDIVGKTYADLYDKKSADFYRKSDKSVIENGISLSLEEPLYQADGTKLIYLSKKVPLHDSDGKIIGMLGISADITERKQMESDLKLAKEAAEAADRAKTEFIANMSHDLRTPISGVIGMAEILEDALDDNEHKTEAHMIHDSGEELLSMFNDILDDIKAGNINYEEVQEEAFDLYESINDLIKLELPTATAKKLGLHLEIDEAVPRNIISDRKKIQRILLNLLGNAIKFTQAGNITVQVKCVERNNDRIKVQFTVSDTGIGIPKEWHSKIFERFFRSTPSYKGIYKGYGLGLHIASSYVNLLGGQITLTSKEGEGSTFQFEIQCQIANPPDKKGEPPLLTINPNQPSTNSPLCLLIEDNVAALKVLEALATKAGFNYKSATSGEEALDLIKSLSFDLIITDIGLPGISGTEFCSLTRLWEKENNKTPQPIVGLTGHAREIAYDECIASGMNDVFTKPANLELIHSLIERFSLGDSSREQEKKETTPDLVLHDLPATEDELFQLEQYALLDDEQALINCGNNKVLLTELLTSIINKEVPEDLEKMKKAYAIHDFSMVEKLAHKIKSGAVYVGATRMKYACQYLERYWKSGQRDLFEKLYQQALFVIDESIHEIHHWIDNQ